MNSRNRDDGRRERRSEISVCITRGLLYSLPLSGAGAKSRRTKIVTAIKLTSIVSASPVSLPFRLFAVADVEATVLGAGTLFDRELVTRVLSVLLECWLLGRVDCAERRLWLRLVAESPTLVRSLGPWPRRRCLLCWAPITRQAGT